MGFSGLRKRRLPHVEHQNYPSNLATNLWEYVIAMGASRYPTGHHVSEGGNRHGYLLQYVRKGEVKHRVDGKTWRVGKGCACFLDTSKAYRHFNDQPPTAELWWLHFDGRNMPHVWVELDAGRNPVFENLDRERFESLFEELWAWVLKRPLAWEARCDVTLNTLVVQLMISRKQFAHAPSLSPQKSLLSEKVRLAVEFLERKYYEPDMSLKWVGTQIGMDIFQLSRKFRREVGIPPMQYLARCRIEQAKHLLTITGESIKHIAQLVGVSNPNYLAELFRKITHQAPGAYRKKQRREHRRSARGGASEREGRWVRLLPRTQARSLYQGKRAIHPLLRGSLK